MANKIYGIPVGVPNPKFNGYTKDEITKMLGDKAEKADISNMCKYMGEVPTFDDLPYLYTFKATGAPYTIGKGDSKNYVGDYNLETGEITFDNLSFKSETIHIPVEEKTLSDGYYAYGKIDFGTITGFVQSEDCTIDCKIGGLSSDGIAVDTVKAKKHNEKTVSYLVAHVSNDIGNNCYINGTSIITASVQKVNASKNGEICEPLAVGHIYKTSDDNTYYVWTGEKWDALGREYGKQFEAMQSELDKKVNKEEMNSVLAKKANKSDIVSAYRFCGSVDKVEDLPIQYALIPNGVPTYKGEPCGTFENGAVTINDVLLEENDSDRIIIPIVPIHVKSGVYYNEGREADGVQKHAYIGEYCTYANTPQTLNECTVKHIELFSIYGNETVNGSSDHLGYLPKIYDGWIDEYGCVQVPTGAYDTGAVYEVKETGLSYGWTGSTWDALGTSHKDEYARGQIVELQSGVLAAYSAAEEAHKTSETNKQSIIDIEAQLGDIETALDAILDIQNGLIGGDSV